MTINAQQPETGALRYRKKPVVVEAYQFHNRVGTDTRPSWIVKAEREGLIHFHPRRDAPGYLTIHTLEGEMRADDGDWIIQGVSGELYPCKPDIFALTYEEIMSTTPAETGGADDPDATYRSVAWTDLQTMIGRLDPAFPNFGDWSIELPAGHWRALSAPPASPSAAAEMAARAAVKASEGEDTWDAYMPDERRRITAAVTDALERAVRP